MCPGILAECSLAAAARLLGTYLPQPKNADYNGHAGKYRNNGKKRALVASTAVGSDRNAPQDQAKYYGEYKGHFYL
jgi:hypothetical protein